MRSGEICEVVERLLERAMVEAPPVDLDALARIQAATVRDESLGTILGCTQSAGRRFVIKLNKGVPQKRRFTYAHEIAHTIFWNQRAARSRQVKFRTSSKGDGIERLCDRTAAEILMPRKWVVPELAKARGAISTICRVATKFETSVESASIRFANLTAKQVGVVRWRADSDIPQISWMGANRALACRLGDAGLASEVCEYLDHALECDHPVVFQGTGSQLFAESQAFGRGDSRYVLTLVKPAYSDPGFRFLRDYAHRGCRR